MTSRTLSDIAALCGARLVGDGEYRITGPAALGQAGPSEISFLADPRYRTLLDSTRAGAVVVENGVEPSRSDLNLLVCDDPGRVFTEVILVFAPPVPRPELGVHASALVDPTAEVSPESSIGAGCVIGPQVRIGTGAVLHPRVVVGASAWVGAGSEIHPGVVLYPRTEIGERCIVHAGAVLGADGFGFEPGPGGWDKTPQCGIVRVGDDVEIGANVTIDRGRFGATIVGKGSKIDNLVHLAHNVEVGKSAMLLAQVGVAGSTQVGDGAILAGQAGVAGHLDIGKAARVGGGSSVFQDVPAGEEYFGYPAKPKLAALRAFARMDKIDELVGRLRELTDRIERLEAGEE